MAPATPAKQCWLQPAAAHTGECATSNGDKGNIRLSQSFPGQGWVQHRTEHPFPKERIPLQEGMRHPTLRLAKLWLWRKAPLCQTRRVGNTD